MFANRLTEWMAEFFRSIGIEVGSLLSQMLRLDEVANR